MGGKRDIWIAASALSLILTAQAESTENLVRRGVTGFVRPPVTSVPESGPARRLRIGDAVFANERIVAGRRGSAQFIMQDRSTITVGPGAELLISEYRYNRRKRTGSMAIKALKGLFRFVGGFISKRAPVRVRVPTGTIGIRGAIVTIDLLPDGGVRLTFFYGNDATYTGDNGEEITLNQGGTVLEIKADGSFEPPFPASEEYLKDLQQRLTGDKGQTVVTTDISDSTGMELLEFLSQDDPLLNIDILEQELNIEGAEFEDVRDTLEEILDNGNDMGSGGGSFR